MAAKALVLSLRSVWCHGNHVNAHASDATIIFTFDSHTNWETFRFALPAWELFTQENESRPWSIRLLAKSRNRRKFIQVSTTVHGFCIFIRRQACCISTAFGHCTLIEYSIEYNLNKTSRSHDCIHALLVSRITVSMCLCRRIQPSPRSSPFAS